LWTAFRADLGQPCPPVDPDTFTGPDTNSTALAVLGLDAQGATAPAAVGADALVGVRSVEEGWAFLAASNQANDANSTGLVLEALRTVNGGVDAQGIQALLGLQAGCSTDPADQGGIAFQPGAGGALAPDALSTAQATAALAEVALPIVSPAIADDLPASCPSMSTTTIAEQGVVQTTTTTPGTANVAAAQELPRTGTLVVPIAIGAACLIAAGASCLAGSRRRHA
jgi:hypothetical protein